MDLIGDASVAAAIIQNILFEFLKTSKVRLDEYFRAQNSYVKEALTVG